MEACVGAHHLSRRLKTLGHDPRLMPAKYAKAFLKGNKNISAMRRRSLKPFSVRPCREPARHDPRFPGAMAASPMARLGCSLMPRSMRRRMMPVLRRLQH